MDLLAIVVNILGFGAVCWMLAQVLERLPEKPEAEAKPDAP